jgi:hypothetical protein
MSALEKILRDAALQRQVFGGDGMRQQLATGRASVQGYGGADAAQPDWLPYDRLPGSSAFYTPPQMGGEISSPGVVDPEALARYLDENGYQIGQASGKDQDWRWIQDASGKAVIEPENYYRDEQKAMLAGLALVGGPLLWQATVGGGLGAAGGASAAPAVGGGLTEAAMAGYGALPEAAASFGAWGAPATAETFAGLGGLAGSAAPGAGALVAGNVDKAALLGNAGYGAGMTGAQTGAFDTVLAKTGSTALAKGASEIVGAGGSAVDWLTSKLGGAAVDAATSAGSSMFSNGWLTDLLGLAGAGFTQMNIEKMAKDNRDWQDKRESDKRRRQMPGALPAMQTTVYRKSDQGAT